MDIESLNTTIENLKALRKTLMEQAQTGIKAAFEGFLKAYPQVKTVVWSQYTPYFNDGDECVFSVNEPTFSPMLAEDIESRNDIEDYEGEENSPLYFYETHERTKYKQVENPNPGRWGAPYTYAEDGTETIEADSRTTPQLRKDAIALSELLQNDDMEDVMKTAFGNHVWVKAYLKDNKVVFDVEEYEHD